MDIVALLRVQRRVGQQGGHAHHAVERSTNFMAHGSQKRRFCPHRAQSFVARNIQFGRTAGYPRFQRFIGVVQGLGLLFNSGPVALELERTVVHRPRQLA